MVPQYLIHFFQTLDVRVLSALATAFAIMFIQPYQPFNKYFKININVCDMIKNEIINSNFQKKCMKKKNSKKQCKVQYNAQKIGQKQGILINIKLVCKTLQLVPLCQKQLSHTLIIAIALLASSL